MKFFNFCFVSKLKNFVKKKDYDFNIRMSNKESNDSQNSGLEDYKNISDGIFPHFPILAPPKASDR